MFTSGYCGWGVEELSFFADYIHHFEDKLKFRCRSGQLQGWFFAKDHLSSIRQKDDVQTGREGCCGGAGWVWIAVPPRWGWVREQVMNRVRSILIIWLRAWADCHASIYLGCAAARRQAGQHKVEWGQATFTSLVWEKVPIVTSWSFILDSCFHFEASSPSTMRLDFGCESPTVHLQFAADFL